MVIISGVPIFRIFSVAKFLHKNIFSDPSLEPSQQDGFDEWSQHVFIEK